MAESREGNVLRVPGYGQKDTVVPVEIIASYGQVFQKGCTLAGNQGVLRAGVALKQSNDLYSAAAIADVASVVGFLRHDVDATSTTDIHEANIVLGGVLKSETLHYSDTVQAARTVADAVIVEADATVTSATAVFTADDVGRTITGSGIPAGATIATRNSATSIELSAPANHADVRIVTDGVTANGDATVTSATAAFVAGDVGKAISGTGIPAATTIASVTSATEVEMSATATADGTGVSVTIGTASKSGQSITVGPNAHGIASASLVALATAMGGKYIANQGFFKF
jgi:hypothetical protein